MNDCACDVAGVVHVIANVHPDVKPLTVHVPRADLARLLGEAERCGWLVHGTGDVPPATDWVLDDDDDGEAADFRRAQSLTVQELQQLAGTDD